MNHESLTSHTGHAVAQLVQALRYNRKVAGSIPDCDIGIFHWYNPSGRTNRNEYQEYFLRVKAAGA